MPLTPSISFDPSCRSPCYDFSSAKRRHVEVLGEQYPVDTGTIRREMTCDSNLKDISPVGHDSWTRNLPIDNHDRSREPIWRHSSIRDIKMVLHILVLILYISKATYLDHLPSVRPMHVHVRIDVEVAVPTSSRLRAMITSTRGIPSISSFRNMIPKSMLFPRYSWGQHLCGR
jgi:hypothetical protein